MAAGLAPLQVQLFTPECCKLRTNRSHIIMKILGIEFAPLDVPLERRLQTFAVFQWTFSFLFLGFGCLFLFLYVLIATNYYYIPLLYALYYYFDSGRSERGGRRINWIRRWKIWTHFANYFPLEIVKTTNLDPDKNYIMGLHPHGVLSVSAFGNFATEGTGWSKKFPGLTPYLMVLAGHFQFPMYRDYFMAGGAVAVTSNSMIHILTKHKSGQALGLVVGGALEALEANPGQYNLKLKNRKGFIKIALKTGKPVHTVFGKPIDVSKTESPSQEQLDQLHKQYIDALTQLFEEHKEKYGVPADHHLNIID
ncbi:Diacylglycerol O-acyltransferase 2B,2-acylglycerol O-acyltransferase 1,Acyl-CoA wax alcohol acyltransferase 1,2-acylglycerol O-acyltransferase 2,Diacylglycerol O-acyltransferase 2A,Diacylglycerol O-acyltransferase 2,Acyl-CoA wax alcohol acyltransferase 2,Diacylglycerol O-acyltransferase 2-like protein 6 [Mytilus coruscus]|uniref:Acyltransferase n=1 Tax=Mytilus coruscus TaxID=42192 RepID=A0A6J8DC40_MYTCO|nr:Diacylglycerol O-acyltransferase 2B,2-acylglycerol O-acyltransferase 1,Acyl-CoA wax alcohol acyltransferase 1,2-acylglycerol O-acyltransferase 2,Diacylglycerol O-acyltransferase 2A,Diacylglycerol O-acyltransferase 2,Acyl-CoA wax alcohol acyltransferase 2,Diacylglycerol O-acyltransferase 2-like protein 6 [Mytilus coruscus]